MTSAADLALARLDDYIRAHDAGADDEAAQAYEEDLFARALEGTAPELDFRAGLGNSLREMAGRGTIDLWLTAREVERMRASKLRVLVLELDPANPDLSDMAGDYDIIITKVPIDLTGIRHLDAEVLSPTGEQLKVMRDIAFDPRDNAVFACCEAELARTAAAFKTVTRVWTSGDDGRRLVCEIKTG